MYCTLYMHDIEIQYVYADSTQTQSVYKPCLFANLYKKGVSDSSAAVNPAHTIAQQITQHVYF